MMGLTTVATAVVLLGCHDLMAPLRSLLTPDSANKYLNPAGTVVVYPGSMRGWAFYDDQASAACTTVAVCAMVSGPGSPSSGSGSAELATTTASEGKALILADYKGVRFDAITALSYSTYRQSVDAGNNLAIALQFNADYDLSDAATGYQGRLVYEPYQGNSGTVTQGAWQNWDAKAGKWWGTRASVMRNGVATPNPCVQATPCTWAALLSAFPNVGVHATYGAVVLKAGSGWASFRGNVDQFAIGVNGALTTFDFEANSPVPATAPLGTSQATTDSAHAVGNLLDNPPGIEGVVTRHTLFVRFRESATRKQREDAIALANADVIGGMHLGSDDVEGFYYVRLQNAIAVSPDSVTGPLLRARALLIALPFVRGVTYDRVDKVVDIMFRRPQDGPGFTTWRLNPDSAQSDNWHLDAIAAPFAWGCAIGGASASVAVVDRWFKHAPDLDANASGVQEFSTATLDTLKHEVPHGTWVAGLLAAKGDNHSAITGIAYAQKVALYNADLPDTTIKQSNLWPVANIQRAAKINRIVNVSMGRQQNGTVTSINTDAAADLGLQAEAALSLTSAFVAIAAGNDGVDASLAGYPRVLMDAEIAKRVIVVGGTQLSSVGVQVALNKLSGPPNHRILIKTNTGPLVEIAAPGDVTTIGPGDSLTSATGTSMAAPLVSGAAALLLDFDPSLTASELKTLLIQGAVAGGRFIIDPANASHHIPFLNAYESLKLAASRKGAPLCGNRVYSLASGAVYATRGPNPDDSLFTSIDGTPYTDLLNALHGGKRIQIGDYREFAWNSSTRSWGSTAFNPNYHENAGGAFLSWYDGTEHEGNTYAIANTVSAGGGVAWGVDLYPAKPAGYRRTLSASPTFPTTSLLSDVCTRILTAPGAVCQSGDSTSSGWVESVSNAQVAFAPQGNAVYVAVNRRWHEQIIYTPPTPCTWFPYYEPGICAEYLPARDSSVSVALYLVDTTATTPWKPVPIDVLSGSNVKPGVNVSWLAIDETGTELVWEVAKDYSDGAGSSCTQHTIEYLRLPNGPPPALPGAVKSVPRPNSTNCGAFGPATFSPLKSPWQQPLLKSLVPSRGAGRRNRPHA